MTRLALRAPASHRTRDRLRLLFVGGAAWLALAAGTFVRAQGVPLAPQQPASPPGSVPAAPGIVPGAPLPSDDEILGQPPGWRVEGFRLRLAFYDQYGRGFQSQAGPRLGPGSERLTVIQGMAQIDLRQSERITHSITVPVDAVSTASANALDAISTASRLVEAVTVQVASNYRHDAKNELGLTYGVHVEQPFRSWNVGIAYRRSLAEDNAVLGVSLNQSIDWFDRLSIRGGDFGRVTRSTSNINVALTQLLSETTVGQLSYGYTFQLGELSNTWNAVPFLDGTLLDEVLPGRRHRHALVGRIAQYLRTRGAAKLLYRFYFDSFGLRTHTVEAQLYQYLGRHLYVRGTYRYYYQNGVDFFAERFLPGTGEPFRTSDSDLAPFHAQLYGLKLVANLGAWQPLGWRFPELSAGFERYQRTNSLLVNIYSTTLAFRF